MKQAWAYAFEHNCPRQDCSAARTAIDAFVAGVRAVEPGDTYVYRFAKDQVEIVRNGVSLGTVRGAGFGALLLSTWIGAAPPTEDLKRSLLRGASH